VRLQGESGATSADLLEGRVQGPGVRRACVCGAVGMIDSASGRHVGGCPDRRRECISRRPQRAGLRLPRQGAQQGEVMATHTRFGDLHGAEFVDAELRGARFVRLTYPAS
jgi:hypothetical protein